MYIYIYIYILESSGRASRGLDSVLCASFQEPSRMLHIIRHCSVSAGSCCLWPAASAPGAPVFPKRAPESVLESLQESPKDAQDMPRDSSGTPQEGPGGCQVAGHDFPIFFENVRSDLSPWGSHR